MSAPVAGIDVVLADAKPEALERALAKIAHNMDRQVAKGTLSAADKGAALGASIPTRTSPRSARATW